jgi:hypothetical protein
MSRDNDLPFERGSTYYNGDSALITAGTGTNLEGKKYRVTDPTSGLECTLIILKQAHSAALTPAGRGVAPKAAYLGRRSADYVGTAGLPGHIVDPVYGSTSIAVNDLYYAIYSGFVTGVKLGASNSTDGGVCCFDSAGYLIPVASTDPATDGAMLVGRFAEAAVTSTGQGNEVVDVEVFPPQYDRLA